MNSTVEAYLKLTRGTTNFRESSDDVVNSLICRMQRTLKKHKIEVVTIWSKYAKNEVISNRGDIKTIIWDTNYWVHCAYYYDNLTRLDSCVKDDSLLTDVQCDALWRDLFRIHLDRLNRCTVKEKFLLTKYYLSYGNRSYQFQEDDATMMAPKAYERLRTIASAKTYVFLHEIAHITAFEETDYYIHRLKDLFSDEMRENVYAQVTDIDSAFSPNEKRQLRTTLNEMETELYAEKYARFEEIISDMRALQSMCNSFMLFAPNDVPNGFLKFKSGIALARSFNLRIRTIEAALHEILLSKDPSTFRKNIFKSQFGTEFIIRDKFSEILDTFILVDCFGVLCNKAFVFKYANYSFVSSKTARIADLGIAYHLNNISNRIDHEMLCQLTKDCSAIDILDYLLYYPSEEQDNKIINNPLNYFGLSGLVFDDFSSEDLK